jgi:juvenile hormone acid methyltransferase
MHKAQLYTSANAMQRRDTAAVLARYRDRMSCPQNCDVLDVGCGSGDVTHNLLLPNLRSVRRLVGVDVSPAMINFAAAHHQHPQLLFRCLDILGSERPRKIFPNGFHKIFSFYCLHWVEDQRYAV